jgi:hypothetical protein
MSLQDSLFVRFVFPRQKLDADFFAGYSDQLASAVCQTSRGQKQEEFLKVQSFDRVFDAQPCACLRDVEHAAIAAPRSVDSHDENVDAAFEIHAFVFSHPEGHAVFLRCLKSTKLTLLKRSFALVSSIRQNPSVAIGVTKTAVS